MASAVDLDMSEVLDLARQLDLRSNEIAEKAGEAVKEAAQFTRDTARDNAPVDTGALRKSLKMTGRALTRRVKANVPYGVYVEFGTSRQAPQPFLYPASDQGHVMLVEALADIASEDL